MFWFGLEWSGHAPLPSSASVIAEGASLTQRRVNNSCSRPAALWFLAETSSGGVGLLSDEGGVQGAAVLCVAGSSLKKLLYQC